MYNRSYYKLSITCALTFFFLFLHTFLLIAQDAQLDPPHNDSEDFTGGCLHCHQMTAYDQPNMIPPAGISPQNIDDTRFNNVCWKCHDGDIAPYAVAHTGRSGDWSVQCWVCHNQHSQEQNRKFGTSYGKFIRAKINPANITGRPKPELGIKEIKLTGDNQFADCGPSYSRICEVCHTQTSHHQNNSDSDHDHYKGQNCLLECHSHANGFAHGSGSSGSDCGTCHGFGGGNGTAESHSTHTESNSHDLASLVCSDCHDTDNFPQFSDGQDLENTTICITCHSVDTLATAKQYWPHGGSEIGAPGSWRIEEGELNYCGSCHDPSVHDMALIGYDTNTDTSPDNILSCDSCHFDNVAHEHSFRRNVQCTDCHWSTVTKITDTITNGKSGGNNQTVFCDSCHNDTAGNPAGNLIGNHHLTPYSTSGLCTKCHVVGPGALGPQRTPCWFCHGENKPRDPQRATANKHEFGPAITDAGVKDFRVCFSCHLDKGQGYKVDLLGSLPPLVTPMHALPGTAPNHPEIYWPYGYYKDASNQWVASVPLQPSDTIPMSSLPDNLEGDETRWLNYPGWHTLNYLGYIKMIRSSIYNDYSNPEVQNWAKSGDNAIRWSVDIDFQGRDYPTVPISFGGSEFDIPSFDGTGTIGQPSGNGSLSVIISPAAAVTDGAQWRLDGGEWQDSGTTLDPVSNRENHLVEFKQLPGWAEPGQALVTINDSEITTVTNSPATYTTCGDNRELTVERTTGDASLSFDWTVPEQEETFSITDGWYAGEVTCEIWKVNGASLEEAVGFVTQTSESGDSCQLLKNDTTPVGSYDLVLRLQGSSCFQNSVDLNLTVNMTSSGSPSPYGQVGGRISQPFLNSLALDTGRGHDILHLSGDVYVFVNPNGTLTTFTIDSLDGSISFVASADLWANGAGNGTKSKLARVNDTMVAVSYNMGPAGSAESHIITVGIEDGGSTIYAIQDYKFHEEHYSIHPQIFPHKNHSNIFIATWIGYRNSPQHQTTGLITVEIDQSGAITLLDKNTTLPTKGLNWLGDIVHVAGNKFAFAMSQDIQIIEVDGSGIITIPSTPGSTYRFDDKANWVEIVRVKGNIFAVSYTRGAINEGLLETISISDNGVISPTINTYLFDPCSSGQSSVPALLALSDSVIGISYYNYQSCDGQAGTTLKTIEIKEDGRIMVPPLDNMELAGGGNTGAKLIHAGGDKYAFLVYRDSSGGPQFNGVKTYTISGDDDGDGIEQTIDNCTEVINAGQVDSDGDGQGDACDPCPFDPDNDIDQDGFCGDVDPCINEEAIYSTSGVIHDRDNDFVCANSGYQGSDHTGDNDNCPLTPNPDQMDSDFDGLGDACDPCPNDNSNDADGDTICGDVDTCPLDAQNDWDGDGICADLDNCPNHANPGQTDGDGDHLGDVCDPSPSVNDPDVDKDCDLADDTSTTPFYFPPTDFSSSVRSDNNIILSWSDAMVGETGYRIERKAESCSADTLPFESATTILRYDDFETGFDTTAWKPGAVILEGSSSSMPATVSGTSGIAEVTWEGGAVKFYTTVTGAAGTGYNFSYLDPESGTGLFWDNDFDIQMDFSYSLTNPSHSYFEKYVTIDGFFPATEGGNSIYVSRLKNQNYTGVQIDGTWKGNGLPSSDFFGKLRMIRKNNRLSGYTWNGTSWYKLYEHPDQLSGGVVPIAIRLSNVVGQDEPAGQEITTYIDNVRFNTVAGVPVANLQLDFDETEWTGNAGEVYDAAVDGNHGTSFGGATTVHDNQRGRVGRFDGIDDYVEIPGTGTLEDLTDGSFTFAAWAKPMSNPQQLDDITYTDLRHVIIARPGYHTGLMYANKTFILMSHNDGPKARVNSIDTHEPGEWHHVTGVIDDDAKTATLYVDGQYQNTVSYTGNLRDYSTLSYFIGAGRPDPSWEFFFDGFIDDVRVFDNALSATEVYSLYANGTELRDSGLDPATTYCYRVYPFKNNGCASWENHAVQLETTTLGSCTDTDSDGTCDSLDECPSDVFNDTDYDGVCVGAGFNDPKTDDNDNCPYFANPNQEDDDANGVGDACYIYQPENISPVAGTSGVNWNPTLSATPFSGTTTGTHKASQWQISTASGADFDANIVYDSGLVADLESHTIAATLQGNTTYYWHVRYQDDLDYWSWYSSETSFVSAVGISPGVAVAEWKFEEGTGSTVIDTIGTNDGLLKNGLETNWTSGVSEGGMSFDGVNDYVEVPPISGFNEFSAEFWVKPDYGNDGVNHTLLDLSDVLYRESFESQGLQEVFECSGPLFADEGRLTQSCDTDGDDYIFISDFQAHTGSKSFRTQTTRLAAPNNGCPQSGATMNFAKHIPITDDLFFDAWAYTETVYGNIIIIKINDYDTSGGSYTSRSLLYGVNRELPWHTIGDDTATTKHFHLDLPNDIWVNMNRNIKADMTSKGLVWDAADTVTGIYMSAYCALSTGYPQNFFVDDISFYRSSSQQKDSAIKLIKSNDNNMNLIVKDKVFTVSNTKVVQNEWNHIVITVSGTSVSMYINGAKEVNDQPVNYNLPAVLTPYLGSNQVVKSLFDGTLDEVLLYNRALTDEEVHGRYIAGGMLNTGVAPDKPSNISPVNGANDVSFIRPMLSGSVFVDSDAGDIHKSSRWQVRKATGVFGDVDSYDSGVVAGTVNHTVGTDLIANTVYSWRVQYQDDKGAWSIWSDETLFTISNTNPAQPVNTLPVDGETNIAIGGPVLSASVFIDSDATDTHKRSQWRVSTANGAAFETNIVYDSGELAASTSHNVSSTNLPTNIPCYWQVRYQDSKNAWSLYSTEFSFTINNTDPDKPVNNTPGNGDTNIPLTPTLTASAFTDSDTGDTQQGSQWLISTGSGVDFDANLVYDSEFVVDTNSHTVVGSGTFNTIYYWKVRYRDSRGDWSVYSDETSFTTLVNVPPDAPTNVTPANGTSEVSLPPTLEASAFSDNDAGDTFQASQWRIRKSTGSYGDADSYDSGENAAASTTHSVTGTLIINTLYYWQVRYQDNNGFWSSYSPETSFTTVTYPSGLVSLWQFDEGSGATVLDTAGSNDGALQNGLETNWTTAGISGNALNFDGVDDYVLVPDSASLQLTGTGTIELWLKPNSTTQDTYTGFVAKTNNGTAPAISYYFHWRPGNNAIRGGISDGSSMNQIDMPLLTDTNWHHVVFVWDGSFLRLYKDGVEAATPVEQTVNAQANSAHPFKIGGYTFAANGGSNQYFNGIIDQVGIYNRALNDIEITALSQMFP